MRYVSACFALDNGQLYQETDKNCGVEKSYVDGQKRSWDEVNTKKIIFYNSTNRV